MTHEGRHHHAGARRRGLRAACVGAAIGLAGCGPGTITSGADMARATPSTGLRSLPPGDIEDPVAVPLVPGSYRVARSAWSVTGFTVTFPAGWTVQYGGVFAGNEGQDGEFGFYAVDVDSVYADACRGETGPMTPVGPRGVDLVRALRSQPGPAVSGPVATTFGGRPATRLDLRIPEDLDMTPCSFGSRGLQVWYSAPTDKYFVLLPHAAASVYVVEDGGRRQVFLTQVSDSTSSEDRAELQAVLDSLRLGSA